MIEFVGNIEDFWSDSLKDFVWPHEVSVVSQREEFSSNYREILQAFSDEIPDYKKFMKALDVEHGSVSLICLQPGHSIPVHNDSFYKLRQDYDVEISQCIRYLTFLEDWVLGHSVDFEEYHLPRWSKGDVFKFDSRSAHCASNASQTDFITCQVNTFIGDSNVE